MEPIPLSVIAQATGVSETLLVYVLRVVEARAVRRSDGQRALRESDARLVAGVALALYEDGVAQRDVKAALQRGEAAAFSAAGANRLGLSDAAQPAPPRRDTPQDALLREDQDVSPAPQRRRASSATTRAVLHELNACLTLLQSVR